MSKHTRWLLGLSVALACAGLAAAQESPIPKVLRVTREFVKPGKSSTAHEKTESAFVQAMARAKWPTYYMAATSLSGPERALFLTRYATLDDWEKDMAAQDKNATLSAGLERAYEADGELLSSVDQAVLYFQEDMSLRPVSDLSHMRFLEIAAFRVKPGHTGEWNEAVKMVKDAYEKAVPEAHWGMYREIFGGEGENYIVLTGLKSLSEEDRGLTEDDARFMGAMGDDGLKRLEELLGASVETSQHQLFAFNPAMSYVPADWMKADDFWKPKAMAPAAKPAAKPAEKKPTP